MNHYTIESIAFILTQKKIPFNYYNRNLTEFEERHIYYRKIKGLWESPEEIDQWTQRATKSIRIEMRDLVITVYVSEVLESIAPFILMEVFLKKDDSTEFLLSRKYVIYNDELCALDIVLIHKVCK